MQTSYYSLIYSTGGDNNGGPRYWITNDLFLRDFDGDGNLDILLDGVVFRGNGDGFFQQAQYLGAGGTDDISSRPPISVICEDLNGDGKADVIYLPLAPPGSQRSYSGTLAVLLNTSNKPVPTNLLGFSSANGGAILAPGMLASVFGKSLAATNATASGSSLPTSLAGVSLRVRDSTDAVKLAPLLFASPSRIPTAFKAVALVTGCKP